MERERNTNVEKGYKLNWHGNKKEARNGVAFIISKNIDAVLNIEYVNGRIIKLHQEKNRDTLTIVQVFIPHR